MGISEIRDAMESAIVARDCFIVDIKMSKNDEIVLTIESEQSCVTLDDCVAISGAFKEHFGDEADNYELTVTSAGLDQPFAVMKQFLKAVGTMVEVSLKGGKKITGLLEEADEDGIRVKYTVKEAVEGKKKKENVEHSDRYPFGEINAVRPHIDF